MLSIFTLNRSSRTHGATRNLIKSDTLLKIELDGVFAKAVIESAWDFFLSDASVMNTDSILFGSISLQTYKWVKQFADL